MKHLQEKLDFLTEKYSVAAKACLESETRFTLDGKSLPLLAHRCERRFIELKNITCGGTLQGVSVMRVARIVEQGTDLFAELYREFDICQEVLQRKIKSVMAMQNDNVMNLLATTEDGVVCTIEISATLAKGEKPKDKHEIISQRGIACDVVVDAQLKQDSIYVFGKENRAYTDVDFELYGLSIEEIAIVRAAFNAAQKNLADELLEADRNLNALVALAQKSVKSAEREVL